MKRIVIACMIAGCLMCTPVLAEQTMTGGWKATADSSIDENAQDVLNKAMDGYTGKDFEAIDLLATQIVSGTNYCFLCRSTAEAPDAPISYCFVYIYEDLQGKASITSVQDIAFGEEQPDETANEPAAAKDEYAMGETWTVDGQWELMVDAVEETADRNEYSDYDPAAVYIVTFTYKNIGYEDDFMDGLYFIMDDRIVDAEGKMGYSYPGDVSMYPQEAPVGASCTGQVCIGVEHPGSFKIYVDTYNGNEEKQSAVFAVNIG